MEEELLFADLGIGHLPYLHFFILKGYGTQQNKKLKHSKERISKAVVEQSLILDVKICLSDLN